MVQNLELNAILGIAAIGCNFFGMMTHGDWNVEHEQGY